MRAMRSRSALVSIVLLGLGCGDDGAGARVDAPAAASDGAASDGAAALGDGWHHLMVPLADGTLDPLWIYAASPAGPGPYPVVVYGHGQGGSNVLPACVTTSAPPTHVDVAPSVAVADALATAGYLGIAVFYRYFDEPPVLGRVTQRDHYLRDAAAMLSAARWGRDQHGRGSSRVAFTGNSMGSFPATWAVAPAPPLAALQAGLDVRAAIPSGMLGNHLANSLPQAARVDDPTLTAAQRVTLITLTINGLVGFRASEAGTGVIDASNLPALAVDLTPLGQALYAALFLDPPPAIAACAGLVGQPASCSGSCASAVISDRITQGAGGQVRGADWFTAATLQAFTYWDPPAAIDPGPTAPSSLLRWMRAMSPAYALPGPLLTANVLPLVSTSDHTLPAQTQGSPAPGQLYLDHLRAVGAIIPTPPLLVTAAGCDHDDYFLPARPECGWDLVSAHLAAALAP